MCLATAALAPAQLLCQEVTAMKQRPSLRVNSFRFLDSELICDFSSGALWPLLPPLFRYPPFTATHTLSHPGICATDRLMTAQWVWAGMAADVAWWCQDC